MSPEEHAVAAASPIVVQPSGASQVLIIIILLIFEILILLFFCWCNQDFVVFGDNPFQSDANPFLANTQPSSKLLKKQFNFMLFNILMIITANDSNSPAPVASPDLPTVTKTSVIRLYFSLTLSCAYALSSHDCPPPRHSPQCPTTRSSLRSASTVPRHHSLRPHRHRLTTNLISTCWQPPLHWLRRNIWVFFCVILYD